MTISIRGKLEWLFLLAVLVGGTCIAWGVGHTETNAVRQNLNYLGLLILTVSAVATLGAFRHAHRKLLLRLGRQLEDLHEHDGGHVIMDRSGEGAEDARPFNQGLATLSGQLEELSQSNHALEIRTRLAETQRHQTENVLGLVSDAVLITNRFDEILFANEAAEHLLGFPLPNVRRKNIDRVLGNGALVRLIRDVRAGGPNQPRQVVEHTFDAHHTPCTFRIMFNCLPGPSGGLSAVVTILHDVTREKEIEHSKTEFVSNVSHELKTPLASIKAYIELLLDGEVNDAHSAREFYQTISAEADRLHRMVDRILSVSRIESGAVPIVLQPVSITAVVKQVLRVVAPQAETKNLRLNEHLPPVYYQVQADYDLIRLAVQNLVVNAIKYTPADGTVTVQVSVDEQRGRITLEVRDTGIGIAAEELGRVFDKFYRVRANQKMASGTGLGLPLVRHIIETILNGTLSATSVVGEGSTFSFELPLVE